jgi:hypothetical protein
MAAVAVSAVGEAQLLVLEEPAAMGATRVLLENVGRVAICGHHLSVGVAAGAGMGHLGPVGRRIRIGDMLHVM